MAYEETLSKRIQLIENERGFTRKEMFGGVGYLLNGNMCVGFHKDELIIRYDPKFTAEVLGNKNVRPFDITA